MGYLIDTNVALWCLAAPGRLSAAALQVLEDPQQEIAFSSISVVEFELKVERLMAQYRDLKMEFARQLATLGFASLDFTAFDATGLAEVRPNRDPFDRMLCSLAMSRSLTLVTPDRQLLEYEGVQTLW